MCITMRYLMWMKEISFTLIKRIVLYQTHYFYRTNYLKLRLFLYQVATSGKVYGKVQ